jgi:hypothetical protein
MHHFFRNGFKEAYDTIANSKQEFGYLIGSKSHDFLAHIDGPNIVLTTCGTRVMTLRPDRSAILHLSRWEGADQNMREIIEQMLIHKGRMTLATSQTKRGRIYTLNFRNHKDWNDILGSVKTNFEVEVHNYEDTQCQFTAHELEVVEDVTKRKDWFAHIKQVRRAAKVAVRVSPFTESQYNILAKKDGGSWWYHGNTPIDTQMDWVNNSNVAEIIQFAVATAETWHNRHNNTSLSWQSQVKAVENFFEKMTRQFHKGNIELKKAA